MWTRIVRKEEFVEHAKVVIMGNTGKKYISILVGLDRSRAYVLINRIDHVEKEVRLPRLIAHHGVIIHLTCVLRTEKLLSIGIKANRGLDVDGVLVGEVLGDLAVIDNLVTNMKPL